MYPLTINREEEEQIRKAAELINEKVERYKKTFSFRDNQDLLAMLSLQIATESLNLKIGNEKRSLIQELAGLNQNITEYLEKY